MTPIASTPWPLRALIGVVAAGLALACGAVGVALIALAGLGKLRADIDLAAIPGWFWYFRADPLLRRWLLIGLGGAGAAGFALVAALLRAPRPPLHGAARWASARDLRRHGLRARSGVVLGVFGGRFLRFEGEEHVLLHAPTRSGKGVGVVIPNLLTWPQSLVVLDVKGENYEVAAGRRAAMGQRVFRFDPLDPDGRTARYNPLGHIARDDPAQVLDELQRIAVMLFPTPPHADPFWSHAARTGFIAVGALVAHAKSSPFCFGAIYRELCEEEVRTRLTDQVRAFKANGDPISQEAAQAISDFCSTSDNTFASIKQTLTSGLNLWLNPRLSAATEVSDFDLRTLRTEPTTIFLCTSPDNIARVGPLYSLFFQQLIDLNTRERPQGARHPLKVLVLLDEFARLGNAQVVAKAFAYVAGYGLRLLIVLQSLAQLRAQYGPDMAEEIIANCAVELAFAPRDVKVAQNLSERLGYFTYGARSTSRPMGLGAGRSSLTQSDQRRALMMAQELMCLAPDEMLVLKAGMAPAKAKRIVYWRNRALRRLRSPPPPMSPHAPSAPGSRQIRGQAGAMTCGPPAAPRPDANRPGFHGEGMTPLPARGATSDEIRAWTLRYLQTRVRPDKDREPRTER